MSENPIARPARVWYTNCMASNVITIRLQRPKAEIEAKAKPNINAWVNKLIEGALGPPPVDWAEHFERKSRTRRFRYRSDAVRQAGR